MSRYIKELTEEKYIAYGYDNFEGYFFQLIEGQDGRTGEDKITIDESSFLTQISKGKMVELMEEYNLPKEHISHVALDLPY